VVLPQDRPQNTNEQIGGLTYAGITEIYIIYPQQPGDFQMPLAQITIPYASAPPTSTVAHVSLPALTFHADIPAGAKNLDYFLPTTRLTIDQRWSPALKNIRAGDSIERTVTVTATKTQAMLIPPIPFAAPDGIRVYQEEPIVQDQKTDRGEFVYGRRTQSAKYFIQKEGDYTLPAIELKWWDLSTNRLVTTTLPAVRITAAANPTYIGELPPEIEPAPVGQPKHVNPWARYKFLIRVVVPFCVAFLLLLWIIWRSVPRTYRALQVWRKQREHSEASYFRNLQVACRRNQAIQAYSWFLKWLTLAYPDLSVNDFLGRAANPALSSETSILGGSLFARNNPSIQWSGRKMAEALEKHRKARDEHFARSQDLPTLNP
jgi:hypothetical protein